MEAIGEGSNSFCSFHGYTFHYGGNEDDPTYVWVVNAYMLTHHGCEPLFGQMTNIYGRRILSLVVFLFVAGSAICGPPPNLAPLVAGRAINGALAEVSLPRSRSSLATC